MLFWPERMWVMTPPALGAMTGIPAAKASSTVSPRVSFSEVVM